ncbi:hypothetical protein DMN91_007776 [Ooceraea biroi]|uniref:Uncharacterized protein n=1 Tax=Ooceraea biroi TaxID=2015173 RepID=A0A3L8DH17_OOCBI|nr:hypothetical protein DMN91_007776 [Ooceraea biroi]
MSLFACCVRRNRRRAAEARQQALLKEPPEISWENTLGSPHGVPFDDDTKELLKSCLDVSVPPPTNLAELIKRSNAFPVKFPISTMRCAALRDRGIGAETVELNANSVYPLIHEAMLPLIARWLKHKRLHGSVVEKAVYKDMSLIQFIHRLLENRAVLSKCLSYDEIKLSAMMIVSSHTEFINDGARKNRGIVSSDPDAVQPRGVIMGVIGTRFARPRAMEYQDIIITPLQNNVDNGYGSPAENAPEEKYGMRVLWAKFYGEDYHPLYEETVKRVKSKDNKRYLSLTNQTIFDIENYMKRTLLSVEIILLDANTRAEKHNTTAFLHVVGFGLGVWRVLQNQEIYFLKTFEIAIRKMNKKLKYVSDIMFAYFRQQKCGGAGNGDYLGGRQRSRSADVDCLKKYTERRVEERRHTEITDTSKLDTSRWMPLPRNLPRGQQSATKRPSRDERQESINEPTTLGGDKRRSVAKPTSTVPTENRPSKVESEIAGHSAARRSHSADVTALKSTEERTTEQRRNTDCGDPRSIATRWLPQINGAKFRRESSPLARIGCEITKSAATRWMTFAKNPSPDPIPKINPERKGSFTEHGKKDDESSKDSNPPKWQPSRKFLSAKDERGHLQRQDELDASRDRSPSFADANERANKLTERMRDLYDFKTENEWPKRTGSSHSREIAWISKSSSIEEEKTNYQPVRRKSQELEFNDRIDIFKSKIQHEDDPRRLKRSTQETGEVFADEREERLRKFNEKLRYSEDRGKERVHARESRRTYSDDYDEKARRESRPSQQPLTIKRPEPLQIKRLIEQKENKRNTDASTKSRDSRVSYAEIEFVKKDSRDSRVSYAEIEFVKKDPRTSDASYASVNLVKRGSVECKSTQQILEVPPRRAFSQTDERPATPIPPIEFNDERYVPKKLPSEPPKRDSTRYKVYLT